MLSLTGSSRGLHANSKHAPFHKRLVLKRQRSDVRYCQAQTPAATAPATGGLLTATEATAASPSASASTCTPNSDNVGVASTSSPAAPSLHDLLSTGARLTTAAQALWAQVLRPGDTAVDATCGNGHDTLFLAQAVGASGHVYGFDVQEAALASTRERLGSSLPPGALPRLSLLHACHSRLQELAGSGAARVVAFNLGYLPGAADKRLVTATATTVAAVEAALEVVMPGGLITILAYVGHPGGMEEYEAVKALTAGLSPSYWVVSETRLLNRPTAPILIVVWRRDDAAPGKQRR